jgi:hypothetical protein
MASGGKAAAAAAAGGGSLSGSYNIFVHCIEARHLAAKDGSADGGTSDPRVVVSCMGKERATRHLDKELNPIWDEWLVLDHVRVRAEHPHELGQLLVSVIDRDLVGDDDEIGSFALDMRYVWHQPNHCLHCVWLPLTHGGDDEGEELHPLPRGLELQGLIKLSVQIRPEDDDRLDGGLPEAEADGGAGGTAEARQGGRGGAQLASTTEPKIVLEQHTITVQCAEFEIFSEVRHRAAPPPAAQCRQQ